MTSDEAIAWAKDQLDEGKDGAELKEKILERGYTEEESRDILGKAKEKTSRKENGIQKMVAMISILAIVGGVAFLFIQEGEIAESIPFIDRLAATDQVEDTITHEPAEPVEEEPVEPPEEEPTEPEDPEPVQEEMPEEEITGQYPKAEFDYSDCLGLAQSFEMCEEFSCTVRHTMSADVIIMEVREADDDGCIFATGTEEQMTSCTLPESYMSATVEFIEDFLAHEDEGKTYEIEGEEVEDPFEKAFEDGLCEG